MKIIVSLGLCALALLLLLIACAPFGGDTALARAQGYIEGISSRTSRPAGPEAPSPTLRPTLKPAETPETAPAQDPTLTPTLTPPTSAPTLTPTLTPPARTPKPTSAPAPTPEPTASPAPETDEDEEFLPDDEGFFDDDLPEPTPEPTPGPLLLILPDDDLSFQGHYITQNDSRYRAYMAANSWCGARMAIALVNVGADYDFYSNIQSIANIDSLLALCNKNHRLPNDYVPDGLRAVGGSKETLRADAAGDYERMAAAMLADLGLELHIVSGYRGYKSQGGVYARYANRDGYAVADMYSARAGHSEHQLGLAIDITHKAPSGGLRRLRFEETPQYAWLLKHAHEYGFILRYPDGWTPVTGYIYEPWHWRYIGPEHAARYHEGGCSVLEEYLGQLTIDN